MVAELPVPEIPFPVVPSHLGVCGAATSRRARWSPLLLPTPTSTSTPVVRTRQTRSRCNAATLLGMPPTGDFQLSARVTVDFLAQYDAGVVLVWIDARHWAKFCFEFSPAAEPMVVSVVTRDISDDANAFVVADRSVWLRVSRVDHVYAFHASTDGRTWRLIRVFTLGEVLDGHAIGFEAQSPTGDGCVVTFDHVHFTTERLDDLRDGS